MITADKPPTAEDVKKAIEGKFSSTGFGTEEQVALTLAQKGWYVRRNPRYFENKEDRHYHEMDILARKQIKKDPKVRILLVIECKKDEKWPWIFLQTSSKNLNPLSVNFATKDEFNDRIYSVIKKGFLRHYYYDALVSTIHLSPSYLFGKTKQEEKIDPIYDAIDQTMNHFFHAANLEADTLDQAEPAVTLVFPIVVLNGSLMTYDTKEVKETKHVLYLFDLLAKEPISLGGNIQQSKPIVIDFVTLDYFNEFLNLVESKGIPWN